MKNRINILYINNNGYAKTFKHYPYEITKGESTVKIMGRVHTFKASDIFYHKSLFGVKPYIILHSDRVNAIKCEKTKDILSPAELGRIIETGIIDYSILKGANKWMLFHYIEIGLLVAVLIATVAGGFL